MTVEPPMSSPIAELRTLLRGMVAPWAVCGGWAIELWLGRRVREHGDVDIAVFRRDQREVRRHLERHGWTLTVARDGAERPWPADDTLHLPDHAVWCRHAEHPTARFELLLNERTDEEFIFRRDPSMRMPLSDAIRTTVSGDPVLNPAVVLLYKAKNPTATDEVDFDAVIPALADSDRAWLRRGLEMLSPDQAWLTRLRAARRKGGCECNCTA